MRTHLYPWDLPEPDATLAEILQRERPHPDSTVIALLRLGSQEILGTRAMPTPTPHRRHDPYDVLSGWPAQRDLSDRLREITHDLLPEPPPGKWPGADTLLYTVVCRDGFVVDTATEWQFEAGWHYANHLRPTLLGDIAVITPHGWLELCTDRAGRTPGLPMPSVAKEG